MNQKLPALLLAGVLCASMLYAQDDEPAPRKKGSLIGFSFNTTDFKTPNVIKANSLSHVLKHGGVPGFHRWIPVFQLHTGKD